MFTHQHFKFWQVLIFYLFFSFFNCFSIFITSPLKKKTQPTFLSYLSHPVAKLCMFYSEMGIWLGLWSSSRGSGIRWTSGVPGVASDWRGTMSPRRRGCRRGARRAPRSAGRPVWRGRRRAGGARTRGRGRAGRGARGRRGLRAALTGRRRGCIGVRPVGMEGSL